MANVTHRCNLSMHNVDNKGAIIRVKIGFKFEFGLTRFRHRQIFNNVREFKGEAKFRPEMAFTCFVVEDFTEYSPCKPV